MKADPVVPPRGMRDFLPAQKALREEVLGIIRHEYSKYGYEEIETPVLEDLSRLLSSEGGDNTKLIFKVMKRGLEGVADVNEMADYGMRYDLTVPLARFYATNRAKLPAVFRSIQIGSVWRAERPQKGRFRQFTQCDLDIIGEPSILAEIELISATVKTLAALGIKGAKVRINDRRALTDMLRICGFPETDFGRILVIVDKIDKIGFEGVEEELLKSEFSADSVKALLPKLESPAWLVESGDYSDLNTIYTAVGSIVGEDGVRLDPSLVRGMGYYTGPIFEIEHPDSGGSIAGGGRYDEMIGRFSGMSLPACGFSIGFERISELVSTQRAIGAKKLALVYEADVDIGNLVRLQHSFIEDGFTVRLVKSPRKLGKLLDSFQEEGFTHFATISGAPGKEEVQLRDLQGADTRNRSDSE